MFSREKLAQYKDKNVHVVGIAGAEGFAILEFLIHLGFSKLTGHNLHGDQKLEEAFIAAHVALDETTCKKKLEFLSHSDFQLMTDHRYLEGIEHADIVFATQNWFAHEKNTPLKTARDNGVPVHFITQLYFDLSPAPIIAVTGTNGKTTVTSCLYHVFREAGIPCLMSGNDLYHPQVLNQLDSLPKNGFLILEVSNRQLKELHRGPDIAVLTCIQPDHLDEHGSFENYIESKKRLFTQVSEAGWSVLNYQDPSYNNFRKSIKSQLFTYGYTSDNPNENTARFISDRISVGYNRKTICFDAISKLPLQGKHNISNYMAVISTALLAGIPEEKIISGLKTFKTVKHRIELLRTLNGSRYFDDVASTNANATKAALDSINNQLVLICGGDIKGNSDDYKQLGDSLDRFCKCLICFPGEASELIAQSTAVHTEHCDDLKTAMKIASRFLSPGIDLLLSPAGAGFQTRYNSGTRGFRKLVRALKRKRNKTPKASQKDVWDIPDFDTALTRHQSIEGDLYFLKHEYQCPTGSHKDRAAVIQIRDAINNSAEAVVIPSSGNAALAIAAEANKHRLPVYAFLAHQTHPGKIRAMLQHQARLIIGSKPVNRARNLCNRFGFPNLRPSRDPLAVVGFMGLGYEIARQDLKQEITDIFIFSTSGASLLGIANAFREMVKNGVRSNMPALHAVQNGASCEVADIFDSERKSGDRISRCSRAGFGGVKGSQLIKPLMKAIEFSKGSGWHVFEEEINESAQTLEAMQIHTSSEGHAAFAAMARWRESNSDGHPLVILTGKQYSDNQEFPEIPEDFLCTSDTYAGIETFVKKWHKLENS